MKTTASPSKVSKPLTEPRNSRIRFQPISLVIPNLLGGPTFYMLDGTLLEEEHAFLVQLNGRKATMLAPLFVDLLVDEAVEDRLGVGFLQVCSFRVDVILREFFDDRARILIRSHVDLDHCAIVFRLEFDQAFLQEFHHSRLEDLKLQPLEALQQILEFLLIAKIFAARILF